MQWKDFPQTTLYQHTASQLLIHVVRKHAEATPHNVRAHNGEPSLNEAADAMAAAAGTLQDR